VLDVAVSLGVVGVVIAFIAGHKRDDN